MPLRHSHARFRMGPRLREDDKKKTKETSRQETVRERVECFVVSRKLATRQTRTALKLVTITEPHSPSPSFSRTREPIQPRPPRVSLAKVLTTTNIYKRRDNVPNAVILANAGTHSSASAECFVSKSPHSDKHLQTKRQRPTITVILANAGTHSSAYAECFVSKSPHNDKHLQTKRQHPHHRHSRERGNPFVRVRREFR